MLNQDFDVIGFWENLIFFKTPDSIITLNKRLPKEDLILKLKIEPEDVKSFRDEILVQASKKQLNYEEKENLLKGKL